MSDNMIHVGDRVSFEDDDGDRMFGNVARVLYHRQHEPRGYVVNCGWSGSSFVLPRNITRECG